VGLDTLDALFEFRVNSTLRLWGRVQDGIFYPIRRDAHHEVCPAGKD
jgi:hypothetical protein